MWKNEIKNDDLRLIFCCCSLCLLDSVVLRVFLPPGSVTIRFPSLNLVQINIPTRNKWSYLGWLWKQNTQDEFGSQTVFPLTSESSLKSLSSPRNSADQRCMKAWDVFLCSVFPIQSTNRLSLVESWRNVQNNKMLGKRAQEGCRLTQPRSPKIFTIISDVSRGNFKGNLISAVHILWIRLTLLFDRQIIFTEQMEQ